MKKFQILILRQSQKNLTALEFKNRIRIISALEKLSANPFLGKKLEGKYKNQYSLKVWPYRIIYEIIKNKLVILIIRIDHRQSSYRK